MMHAWLEAAWILGLAFAVAIAVVPWLTALLPMEGEQAESRGGVMRSIERPLLRVAGHWPPRQMTPATYAAATVVMHAVGFVVLLALLRLQGVLPWNPDRLPAVPWGIAINTAVSFVTNTNWQSYAGETTLSPLSQVCGLTVQNFVSAAIGLCALAVVVRGFARQGCETIGNFWQDLVRGTVALLLPLATLVAAVLVWQGAAQSLATSGGVDGPARTGPIASQTAIALVGTNGGGYFNANAAHPLANPTPLTNAVAIAALLVVAIAGCLAFGRWVGDRRQGRALLLANVILFLPGLAVIMTAETRPNPTLPASVDQTVSDAHDGGSLEGKEVRFGSGASALFAAATTATSTGAVDAMHDSLSPLGGLVTLWMMQLGEVVFGGVGTGVAGMIVYAIVAVFVAGLMVGRSPEYVGKKIEAREMKLAMLILLVPPLTTLLGTAAACVVPAAAAAAPNPGPHGFSDLLYAFTSAANNNGSAFGGLDATSTFWTLSLATAMAFGRILSVICLVLLGGSLAAKRPVAASIGTLPTHGLLFIFLVAGVVNLVGALSFVPALALGPIAEALQPLAGGTP
jgi:potassium-transporting ATPase potassium-binding subunit